MTDRYTTGQLAFLRRRYKALQIPELTVEFNRRFGATKSETAIKSALSNHGFTCGRPRGVPAGTYRAFSQEQAMFMEAHYQELGLEDLTLALNRRFETDKSVRQVRAFLRNHRIRSGRTGQFKKGDRPWNYRRKGLTGANPTSFKKGAIPKNIKPLGHERICSKDGYILIKVAERNPYTGAPTRYKAKHVVVWEQQHGPVPEGMVLSFIDGNKLNCAPGNLELIGRAEHLLRNRRRYAELPDELKPSMRTLTKLETKVFSFNGTPHQPRGWLRMLLFTPPVPGLPVVRQFVVAPTKIQLQKALDAAAAAAEGRGYREITRVKVRRDQYCPCGSGQRLRACCLGSES